MCTVEVPTCRPICLAEIMRKVNRVRNQLNRRSDNNNNENDSPAVDENFRSIRRVLFDDVPVDHELRRQILARETARIRRNVSARWNFDFETETPLTGRFQWTPVTDHASPVATSIMTTSENVPAASMQSTPSEVVASELVSVASVSTMTDELESTPRKTTRQRKLTDYMPQRKRSFSSSSKVPGASPDSKVRRTIPTTPTTTAL